MNPPIVLRTLERDIDHTVCGQTGVGPLCETIPDSHVAQFRFPAGPIQDNFDVQTCVRNIYFADMVVVSEHTYCVPVVFDRLAPEVLWKNVVHSQTLVDPPGIFEAQIEDSLSGVDWSTVAVKANGASTPFLVNGDNVEINMSAADIRVGWNLLELSVGDRGGNMTSRIVRYKAVGPEELRSERNSAEYVAKLASTSNIDPNELTLDAETSERNYIGRTILGVKAPFDLQYTTYKQSIDGIPIANAGIVVISNGTRVPVSHLDGLIAASKLLPVVPSPNTPGHIAEWHLEYRKLDGQTLGLYWAHQDGRRINAVTGEIEIPIQIQDGLSTISAPFAEGINRFTYVDAIELFDVNVDAATNETINSVCLSGMVDGLALYSQSFAGNVSTRWSNIGQQLCFDSPAGASGSFQQGFVGDDLVAAILNDNILARKTSEMTGFENARRYLSYLRHFGFSLRTGAKPADVLAIYSVHCDLYLAEAHTDLEFANVQDVSLGMYEDTCPPDQKSRGEGYNDVKHLPFATDEGVIFHELTHSWFHTLGLPARGKFSTMTDLALSEGNADFLAASWGSTSIAGKLGNPVRVISPSAHMFSILEIPDGIVHSGGIFADNTDSPAGYVFNSGVLGRISIVDEREYFIQDPYFWYVNPYDIGATYASAMLAMESFVTARAYYLADAAGFEVGSEYFWNLYTGLIPKTFEVGIADVTRILPALTSLLDDTKLGEYFVHDILAQFAMRGIAADFTNYESPRYIDTYQPLVYSLAAWHSFREPPEIGIFGGRANEVALILAQNAEDLPIIADKIQKNEHLFYDQNICSTEGLRSQAGISNKCHIVDWFALKTKQELNPDVRFEPDESKKRLVYYSDTYSISKEVFDEFADAEGNLANVHVRAISRMATGTTYSNGNYETLYGFKNSSLDGIDYTFAIWPLFGGKKVDCINLIAGSFGLAEDLGISRTAVIVFLAFPICLLQTAIEFSTELLTGAASFVGSINEKALSILGGLQRMGLAPSKFEFTAENCSISGCSIVSGKVEPADYGRVSLLVPITGLLLAAVIKLLLGWRSRKNEL